MLRHVRWVHGRHGRLVVAPRGAFGTLGDGHAMKPGALDVHAWLSDPTQRPVIIDLLRKSLGIRVDLQRADLREYAGLVTRAFESGDLRARKMKLPHLHRDRADEAAPPPKPTEKKQKHVLDYVVEYPDGTPVSDYAWELVHPSGKRETGTLGGDGLVHRDDVPAGSYELILKDVERVRWREEQVVPGKDSVLIARTCGFANGTSAKVRLFRELEETDDDVVETLQGTVKDDVVELEIRVDPKKHGAGRPGTLRLVAEVSVEGGKYWAKTLTPLTSPPPGIVAAKWTRDHIGGFSEEKETVLRVTTASFADGTKVRADMRRTSPDGGEEKLSTVETTVAGNLATFPFVLDEDLTAAAPPLEGDKLRRWGEYRALLRIGDAPEIVALSPLLAVETTDPDLQELRKVR